MKFQLYLCDYCECADEGYSSLGFVAKVPVLSCLKAVVKTF